MSLVSMPSLLLTSVVMALGLMTLYDFSFKEKFLIMPAQSGHNFKKFLKTLTKVYGIP